MSGCGRGDGTPAPAAGRNRGKGPANRGKAAATSAVKIQEVPSAPSSGTMPRVQITARCVLASYAQDIHAYLVLADDGFRWSGQRLVLVLRCNQMIQPIRARPRSIGGASSQAAVNHLFDPSTSAFGIVERRPRGSSIEPRQASSSIGLAGGFYNRARAGTRTEPLRNHAERLRALHPREVHGARL